MCCFSLSFLCCESSTSLYSTLFTQQTTDTKMSPTSTIVSTLRLSTSYKKTKTKTKTTTSLAVYQCLQPPPQPTPLHFIYHKTCLMLIYKALPLYPSIGLLWAQSHQLSLSLSIYCHTPRFFFSHSPRPSNICHGKLKSVRKLNSHIAGMYMTSQAACLQTAKEHGRGFNQLLGVCS